ncbi:MAG: 50S ribosomal protein L4 [Patescibacteria group bacterium]
MVTKKTTTKKAVVTKKPRVSKAKVPAKSATPGALSASVYDMKGKVARSIELPEVLFGAAKNDSLVRQVVLAMEANARTPVAHTKTRGEVRGGGKKPWKQKGTGRARHGSSRSPIWKGGGITFGPRNEKDYSQKINKKMRTGALAAVLSERFGKTRVLFVESVFSVPKTKEAKALLGALGGVKGFEELATRRNNAALIITGAPDSNLKKSFSNMGNVKVDEARNLNPVDIMNYRFLVITNPEAALETLTKRMK